MITQTWRMVTMKQIMLHTKREDEIVRFSPIFHLIIQLIVYLIMHIVYLIVLIVDVLLIMHRSSSFLSVVRSSTNMWLCVCVCFVCFVCCVQKKIYANSGQDRWLRFGMLTVLTNKRSTKVL